MAMEMSGHPTALPEIIANLNHGGRIAMLGPARRSRSRSTGRKVVTHMITIKGIYGREMFETWYAMSAHAALRSGHLVGDHAPLRGRRLGRGVRDGARRRSAARSSWIGARGLAMYGAVRDQLQGDAGRDPRGRAVQERARARLAAVVARRRRRAGRAELLRQQLPRPGRPSGRRRRRQGGAGRVGLRHGARAVHLRHADPAHRARAAALGVPRHRGDDPVLVVLRRQRRRVRGAAGRRRTR